MKVFCTDSNSVPFNAQVSVDSAVRLRNEPFFAPDDSLWQARLYIGARISRLGMNIASRFAPRYFESITILAHPTIAGQNIPYEWTRDCAIINNGDLSLENAPERIKICINAPGEPNKSATVELEKKQLIDTLAEAVSAISRWHTLKTGDIIAIPLELSPLNLNTGANYFINIDSLTLLHLKSR